MLIFTASPAAFHHANLIRGLRDTTVGLDLCQSTGGLTGSELVHAARVNKIRSDGFQCFPSVNIFTYRTSSPCSCLKGLALSYYVDSIYMKTYGWGQHLHQSRYHVKLGSQRRVKPREEYQRLNHQCHCSRPGKCGRVQPSDRLRG